MDRGSDRQPTGESGHIGGRLVAGGARSAQRLAGATGLDRAVESAVESIGMRLGELPGARQRPEVVIADPSRQGLGQEAVEALAGLGAAVFVLVSCDPVAMARDTALLAQAGYRHAGTDVLDLFPHTHHVEAVTRFERAR